jgi:hypothetical protein
MRFKHYCVTVMDNWTPLRFFWTFGGAIKFRNDHIGCAHLHHWTSGQWVEVIGPPITTTNSAPAGPAPQNSAERLPMDKAGAGAGTAITTRGGVSG